MPSTWPASLPQTYLIEGFAQGFGRNVIRSSIDVGPPMLRRRTTSAPKPMQGSFLMTDAQLIAFKAFFDGPLAGGVLTFFIPAQPPFVGTYLVRFAEELPQWDYMAPDAWKVDVKLEILPGVSEPVVPPEPIFFDDIGVSVRAVLVQLDIFEPLPDQARLSDTLTIIAPQGAALLLNDGTSRILLRNGTNALLMGH